MLSRSVLALFALAASSAVVLPAAAESTAPVVVTLDQAKVMRIAAPASTIIIGNPGIADATLQDSETLVITGRSYGVTNLIILDSAGEPIADTQVMVQGPTINLVTVHRGSSRYSLTCAENCEPTLVPGDDSEYYNTVQTQAGIHNGTAAGGGN